MLYIRNPSISSELRRREFNVKTTQQPIISLFSIFPICFCFFDFAYSLLAHFQTRIDSIYDIFTNDRRTLVSTPVSGYQRDCYHIICCFIYFFLFFCDFTQSLLTIRPYIGAPTRNILPGVNKSIRMVKVTNFTSDSVSNINNRETLRTICKIRI